jgi:threonine aldolase
MANQVALGSWTRPGDEIVADRCAHVVQWEAGAPGFLHGVTTQLFDSERGVVPLADLRRPPRPSSIHCPNTALLCVEQTWMGSGEGPGGCVIPFEHLRAVRELALSLSVPVHMDGARLANAVAASGRPAHEWAACADSVSICLSKGLGAPVGSLIAGDRAFVERGRLVRKRLGGWMRQAGYLAAAGRFALEHHVERLRDDHDLARALAAALDALPGLACDPSAVETNIVMVAVEHPEHTPASLADALAAQRVLVLPMNDRNLRFVTHLNVGPEDVERLAQAAAGALSA